MPVNDLDLIRGTVDLMVLKILALGPLHGYAIASRIRDRSDGELLVHEGALYPALHRLEVRDLVSAEWGITPTGRRARYYALTPAGRSRLKAETATWRRYVLAVGKVLEPSGGR